MSIDTRYLPHLCIPLQRKSTRKTNHWWRRLVSLYLARYLLLYMSCTPLTVEKIANMIWHPHIASRNTLLGRTTATLKYEYMEVSYVCPLTTRHDHAVCNQAANQNNTRETGTYNIPCEGCDVMLHHLSWCEGVTLRYDCHTNHSHKKGDFFFSAALGGGRVVRCMVSKSPATLDWLFYELFTHCFFM